MRLKDRRWYLWVPGMATLLCVPFQFLAYLSPTLLSRSPSFVGLMFMAAVFFGPSFAMTQALATVRMRSVATSLLLFIQTLIGNGLGPADDRLHQRLAGALAAARLAALRSGDHRRRQIWAALHYALGRADAAGRSARRPKARGALTNPAHGPPG